MLRVVDPADSSVLVTRDVGDARQYGFLHASFGHRLIEVGYMPAPTRWQDAGGGSHVALCTRIEPWPGLRGDEVHPVDAVTLPAQRVVELLGQGAATWAEQGIIVTALWHHLEVRASDGELLGLVDVEAHPGLPLRQPVRPLQYRAVIVPTDRPPRSVPMPGGYIPERPGRAADGERIRWKAIPGVQAPETMRP